MIILASLWFVIHFKLSSIYSWIFQKISSTHVLRSTFIKHPSPCLIRLTEQWRNRDNTTAINMGGTWFKSRPSKLSWLKAYVFRECRDTPSRSLLIRHRVLFPIRKRWNIQQGRHVRHKTTRIKSFSPWVINVSEHNISARTYCRMWDFQVCFTWTKRHCFTVMVHWWWIVIWLARRQHYCKN
jgi:hypothetical protein